MITQPSSLKLFVAAIAIMSLNERTLKGRLEYLVTLNGREMVGEFEVLDHTSAVGRGQVPTSGSNSLRNHFGPP